MAGTRQLVLLVCVGLCVLQSVIALKCYDCKNLPACNDEFDSGAPGVKTDNACTGSCIKFKAGSTVSRYCSPVALGNKCDSQRVGEVDGSACSCTSDLCNSASGVKVSIATVSMAVFIAVSTSLY